MAEDVELAALDHQAPGHIQGRRAGKVRPLVEAAALLIYTDTAPEGQGRLLHPGEKRRNGRLEQRKIGHERRNGIDGKSNEGVQAAAPRSSVRIFSTIRVVLELGTRLTSTTRPPFSSTTARPTTSSTL